MLFMQLLVVVRIGIVPEEFLHAIEEGSTGLGGRSKVDYIQVHCRCPSVVCWGSWEVKLILGSAIEASMEPMIDSVHVFIHSSHPSLSWCNRASEFSNRVWIVRTNLATSHRA